MPKSVLCRYWLHGGCNRGSSCPFSHDLADAESQVCRYYLKGECAYGDRCRYEHTRPDWSAASRRGQDSSSASYAAPAAPRPTADDLADQLPISRLRLGGQAAAIGQAPGAAPASASSMPLPLPLPLPVQLPSDPFGSAQGGGGEGTDSGQGDWGGEGQHTEQQAAWHDDGGEEGYWVEDEGGAEYWVEGEEGEWPEEEYWEGAEGAEDGSAAWTAAQQHQGLQPPGGGDGGQQAQAAWGLPEGVGEQQQWAAASHPSLQSLCMQWFKTGACPKGSRCPLVHGDLCQHCGKHALHPSDAAAREQHSEECRIRHERLAARARSAAVECGICLEPVLSKAAPGDRKFGLLTGCDHPFCLHCIRSWRQKTDAGADVDTALRTCPVCRTTSHYIVPSLVWPTIGEEKEQILAGYKAKLSGIHCQYFDRGSGTCPFGTSCFYRHEFPDGRMEEPSLRKAADEEGNVRVMQPVRLSDFIVISTAGQRVLRSGRRR